MFNLINDIDVAFSHLKYSTNAASRAWDSCQPEEQ